MAQPLTFTGRGIARSGHESEFPSLWRELRFAGVPGVMSSRDAMIDFGARKRNATLTNPIAANVLTLTARGRLLAFDGTVSGGTPGHYLIPALGENPFRRMTYAAVIRLNGANTATDGGMIFSFNSTLIGTSNSFLFRVNNDQTIQFVARDTSANLLNASGGSVSYGVFHHVAATVSTSGLCKVYVDGRLSATATQAGWVGFNMTSIATTMGAELRANYSEFNGYIDEPMIWGRDLSPSEIMQMSAGATPFAPRRRRLVGKSIVSAGHPVMRRWAGSIMPTGVQRFGRGW